MPFDDLLGVDDFVLDPEDVREITTTENWDTGNDEDIFVSGNRQDIFSTKD